MCCQDVISKLTLYLDHQLADKSWVIEYRQHLSNCRQCRLLVAITTRTEEAA